jgi:AcrR family transcriptional regulator
LAYRISRPVILLSFYGVSSEKRRYELKARADSQRETGNRIAAAATSLHEEVGIANTTIADIARRAGVQRPTVYAHFPDLAALLPACTAHWLGENPLPDLGAVFAIEDPVERLRTTLASFYPWYRTTATMQQRLLSERTPVSVLDKWLEQSLDPVFAEITTGLAAGFSRPEARVLVALALDFWTWRRLDSEGVSDTAAAELMAEVVGE